MDRYYSTPKVFQTLLDMGFGDTRTCMKNRTGLSNDMLKEIEKLSPLDVVYYESQELLLTVWKDSKTVFLLSTVDKVQKIAVKEENERQLYEY